MAQMQYQYVTIPKDMGKIKKKFMFGMTKRQVIFFGGAFLIGIPTYLIMNFYFHLPTMISALSMMLIAAPLIAFGAYHVNGLYLDEYIKYMIRFFRSPKIRTYQSTNVYQQLADAAEYHKCAIIIERATGKKVTYEKRKPEKKRKKAK